MRTLRPLGAAVTLAALLALPAVASATGTYTVYACKGPSGGPVAADAWTPFRANNTFADDNCASGGTLAVGMTGSGAVNAGDGAQQSFTAPPDTRIVAARVTRRTAGLGSGQQGIGYRLQTDDTIRERCDPGVSSCTSDLSGDVSLTDLDAGSLAFRVGCFEAQPDSCSPGSTPPRVDVGQVVETLADRSAPAVSNLRGSLTGAVANATGSLSLAFDATDRGGGLYRMLVLVDGRLTQLASLARDACSDLQPGDADDYQFAAAVPCPLTLSGVTASLDTTALANGPHTVEVMVEDAAANRTVVLPASVVTVANPTPVKRVSNGIGADVKGTLSARFDANGTSHLRNRYGRRVVIRGRLLDTRHAGIRGARLDVYHRRNGKKTLTKTGLKTRADGRFTLILPLDLTTRDIIVAYRATRPGAITSQRTLRLTVVSAAGNVVTARPGKLGRNG